MNKLVVAKPCIKVDETTVADWFAKLDEEVAEFKAEILKRYNITDILVAGKMRAAEKARTAEEGADICTVVTSIDERMGIMLEDRLKAQLDVNIHNSKRGRL